MSWKDQQKKDPFPWLLDAGLPGVRYLALRDLSGLPAGDPELQAARQAAHTDGPIAAVLAAMDPEGYWVEPGPGYNPKYRSTVWAMILLAELGARIDEDERIALASQYLLDHSLALDSHFSTSGAPSGTIDCLQGNLCWALNELGCEDPRLELAFEWMARSVTGEGIAPLEEKQAAMRYYAGKCGPGFACGANNKLPCAWGAVKVMQAFAGWPVKKRTPLMQQAIQVGIDFLLSIDPATAAYPTGFNDKPSQSWWKFGFPVFYVTDILQIVEVMNRLGYRDDPRLANALALVRMKQDAHGRWPLEYDYSGKTWVDFGPKRKPNPWVTIRALKGIKDKG